jgi:hypothetical protein
MLGSAERKGFDERKGCERLVRSHTLQVHLSLGAAPDTVRDQVLRHDPLTGVFSAAYRGEFVRFNVQDAYLERTSLTMG